MTRRFTKLRGARTLRLPLVLATAATVLLSLPIVAPANHWPNFGGDGGRSGDQPVNPGVMPVTFKYQKAEAGRIQTSIVTTGGGGPLVQRLVYGTTTVGSGTSRDCQVHLQVLSTGAPIGPEAGIDICSSNDTANENAFGTKATDGSVTPNDSSSASALGQVFVIHNDMDAAAIQETGNALTCTASDNDIAIAQIDEATGTLVKDVAIGRPFLDNSVNACGSDDPATAQITDGFSTQSSPVMTPALNANGDRALFFIAASTTTTRLYKVNITAASAMGTTLAFSYKETTGANTSASPSIAYLRDPNLGGDPVPFVVVPQGAAGGGAATYRVSNLTPGPKLPADGITGTPWTPSSPVTDGGRIPGEDASGIAVTPFFYVPVERGGETFVYKVRQQPTDESKLETVDPDGTGPRVSSPALKGTPGKAMAVTQPFTGNFGEGRIVVTTGSNLYILNTTDLSLVDRLRDEGEGDLVPGSTGFSRTAPAISGNFIYTTSDIGTAFVFRLSDGERVCAPADPRTECAGKVEFAESFSNRNPPSTFGIGQPAISNGFIQFTSNNGAFVYRNVDPDASGPVVTITEPAPGARVSGNAVSLKATATDPDGVAKVEFLLTGQEVGEDTDPPNQPPSTFTATFDSTTLPDGAYAYTAVGTDGVGDEGTSPAQTLIIDNIPDPTAKFTYSPSSPQPSGTQFSFDGSTSTPAGTPAGQAITSYDWDFQGDGEFDATGQSQTFTYTVPGTYNATLRVTQTNGQTDTETQTIVIANRPPVAAFTASPNPASPGQLVSFNGASSNDADGTIVKFEWDLDGDSTFEVTTTTSATSRTYTSAGTFNVKLRVTDDRGGTSTVATDLVVAGPNTPPTAAFTITPAVGTTGRVLTFDASSSNDPDGRPLVRYQWDLDGNGSFETDSGANPRTTRTYFSAGVINVRLRVTDVGGATNETLRQLVVLQGAQQRQRPSVSLTLKPKRDLRAPYRFTASGRVSPPRSVTGSARCAGTVTIQTKAGNNTLSTKTARLRNCRYSAVVRFKNAKRFGRSKVLRVSARFRGNTLLTARRAAQKTIRVKR